MLIDISWFTCYVSIPAALILSILLRITRTHSIISALLYSKRVFCNVPFIYLTLVNHLVVLVLQIIMFYDHGLHAPTADAQVLTVLEYERKFYYFQANVYLAAFSGMCWWFVYNTMYLRRSMIEANRSINTTRRISPFCGKDIVN